MHITRTSGAFFLGCALLFFCCTFKADLTQAQSPNVNNVVSIKNDRIFLPFAYASREGVENLFDATKRDEIIVLLSHALSPGTLLDATSLSFRSRTGELSFVMLRISAQELVNVKIGYHGVSGIITLPGNWFTFKKESSTTGKISLASRTYDGIPYALSANYSAEILPDVVEPTPVPYVAEPTPTTAPASVSAIDTKELTALMVNAIMNKDEDQAIKILGIGADPNGRDQHGMPLLNWAVMMCQPRVIVALLAKGASVTYERAPGMTILTEAGACPDAARILRSAGAK